ncbi:MAG: hypothetical protein Q8933_21745, partial [Bacteroidota bacterium]|nr:hypothetical protein [Bacteroidota bacterium]
MDEKLELLKKYNLEKDKLDFSIDDLSLEDLEIKLKEMSKPDSSFSLSNNQLEDEIRKVLRGMTTITHDYWGDAYEQQLWYFRDIKDGIVIVIDSDWSNYYGVPYTVSGDNVTLDFDNKVPYVADWRPKQEGDTASNFVKEEVEAIVKYTAEKAKEKFEIEKNDAVKVVQDKLDEASKDFTTLKTENEELKEFKNTRLSEIRQEQENELFTKFSKLDGDEDYETIKTNAKNYSIEDLEKEIAVVYARKTVTFSSKSKEKSTIKVPVDFSKDEKKGENPYGDVFIKYKK